MRPTLDDLRGALREEADSAAYPDVDALVAGARRRVAAARGRRLTTLAVATVAILLAGGLLATTGSSHRAVPRPAGPGPYKVISGDAGFPEYSQGMRRIAVLEAPVQARMRGAISLHTTPGRQLAMKMTCTSSQQADLAGEWTTSMVAHVSAPGGKGDGVCGLGGGLLGSEMSSPLSQVIGVATGPTATVTVDAAPLVTAPRNAKIHLALYQSVPWDEYAFPKRPARMDPWPPSPQPNRPDGTIWHSDGSESPQGPTTVADANTSLTMSFGYDPKRALLLEVRGPGRLRVLIDGLNVSTEIAGSSGVRDGYVAFWAYSSAGSLEFPLDPRLAAPSGALISPARPGASVSLTVIPEGFVGPDWRVTYLTADQRAAAVAQ